jgi:hypothetical protein
MPEIVLHYRYFKINLNTRGEVALNAAKVIHPVPLCPCHYQNGWVNDNHKLEVNTREWHKTDTKEHFLKKYGINT